MKIQSERNLEVGGEKLNQRKLVLGTDIYKGPWECGRSAPENLTSLSERVIYSLILSVSNKPLLPRLPL